MSDSKHTPCPTCGRYAAAPESQEPEPPLSDDFVVLLRKNGEKRETIRELVKALAFARCCIKSGEPWTDTCEEVIGAALTAARGQKETP